MATSSPHSCWAIAAPGLEPLVAAELRALGVARVEPLAGGVEFSADEVLLARLHLQLRVASRVLVRLGSFRAVAFHELERSARQLDWKRFVASGAPVALRVTCKKSRLYHSDAVAQRVRDAIVHVVGPIRDPAPSEDDDAEGAEATLIVVRFDHDRCTISVDASGALLHRRGYRQAVARAPLRETLAAAMLAGVPWKGDRPLLDPMCGSGTIAIEAACLARGLPPGQHRRFAAESWPIASSNVWASARAEALTQARASIDVAIHASDRDEGAIAAARANAERAGVLGDITFEVRALSAAVPPAPHGLLIANPPYGIRVGESAGLRDLFARLGQMMRGDFSAWSLALLSADPQLERQLRLPLTERFRTQNGGIPVRLITAPPQE